MSSRVIVNAAIGAKYQRECASMRWHCRKHAAGEADLLFFDDYPPACPTQSEMQYAFKIYAIIEAIRRGYRQILWMDIVFMPQRSLAPVWERIEREGWWVPPQEDHVLGNWISDDALARWSTTRDEAMQIPLVYSGLVGVDLNNSDGQAIWDLWRRTQAEGEWNGPHRNEPGTEPHAWGHKIAGHCSYDERCYGHRHDESSLSLILHALGLKPEYAGLLGPGCCIEAHVPLPLGLVSAGAESAG